MAVVFKLPVARRSRGSYYPGAFPAKSHSAQNSEEP